MANRTRPNQILFFVSDDEKRIIKAKMALVLLTAWQVIKATRRSVSARRSARQAERDEQARRQELEEARSRAYAAGQEDAKAASRVAENASSAADSRENP